MKVAVVGGAGYAAGELLRVLLQHPEVSDLVVTSRSQAGSSISEVHPGLAQLTDDRFSGAEPWEAARGRDVVFLALEAGESSRLAGRVLESGPGLVVDLAADFRVQDLRLYSQYYGTHGAPGLVSRFRYGLADVVGAGLRDSAAIAVPGCFATAAQLTLFPLARAGARVSPSLFGVTGSSGAGAQAKPTTHHPSRAHNLFGYSPLNHRHEAEILERWREWTGDPNARARLLTHAGPFVRGIYLTLHAFLPPGERLQEGDATGWFREAYHGRPFVRVLENPPQLTHAIGTNLALVHAMESADGTELQVSIAIDNLMKGAGGQAVQAMNLALGLDECSGLLTAAAFPL